MQDEQRKDDDIVKLIDFLESPDNPDEANKVIAQMKKGYCYVVDRVLYYEGADMPGEWKTR